jgi:hypothetical protein
MPDLRSSRREDLEVIAATGAGESILGLYGYPFSISSLHACQSQVIFGRKGSVDSYLQYLY